MVTEGLLALEKTKLLDNFLPCCLSLALGSVSGDYLDHLTPLPHLALADFPSLGGTHLSMVRIHSGLTVEDPLVSLMDSTAVLGEHFTGCPVLSVKITCRRMLGLTLSGQHRLQYRQHSTSCHLLPSELITDRDEYLIHACFQIIVCKHVCFKQK